MIINESKYVLDKYIYKPLAQLKKEHNCKNVPTPSKILAHKNKASEFMAAVLHNPNHVLHSTIKTSVVNGNNTHSILNNNVIDTTKYTQQQNELYQAIQEQFQNHLEPMIDEIWGKEKGLLVPNSYGGKFDSVGVIQGTPMMWDYKKINKRKTKSQIENYIQQTAAYAQAHNHQYGTDITNVAVMTIYGTDPDKIGSDIFIINGSELKKHTDNFNTKLKQYYEDTND